MLSRRRNKAAAKTFFRRVIEVNGIPQRIVIDKSGANLSGLLRINVGLKFSRSRQRIEILRVKYINNIVEQDHRFIKKITRPALGFKVFHSATVTLAGIETAHMPGNGNSNQTTRRHLNSLPAWLHELAECGSIQV